MKQFGLILLMAMGGLGTVTAQELPAFDRVAAVVEDSIITLSEIQRLALPTIRSLQTRLMGQPQVLESEVTDAIRESARIKIERQMIMYEYKRNFSVPESVIERRIEQKIKEGQFQNRANLVRSLQAQGRTYESWYREERENLIVSFMNAHFVPREKILVSPYKLESFYAANQTNFIVKENVKLRRLQISKSRTDAAKLAQQIVAQLDGGSEFVKLADQYHDLKEREPGGRWDAAPEKPSAWHGWEKGDLPKESDAIAFALKPKQHSRVIELPDCYLILYLEERVLQHVRPLAEVREVIEQKLADQELERLRKNWVAKMEKSTYVHLISN
ncbi:MAG: peptidyl-prolyl cis-trans isomerase [Verrucomicrobiota bacterium]